MKKIRFLLLLCLVLCLTALTVGATAEPQWSLTAENADGEITVTVAPTSDAEFASLGFYLTYPADKVTLTDTADALTAQTFGTVTPLVSLKSGQINYGVISSDNVSFDADEAVLTLHFSIVENAKGTADFALTDLNFAYSGGSKTYGSGDTYPSASCRLHPEQFSFSLSPEESIRINFYCKLEAGADPSDYTVQATFNEETSLNRALTSADFQKTVGVYDSYCVVVAEAFSYDMTKPVSVTVKRGDDVIKEVTYSVRQYCTNKLGGTDAKLNTLCSAMLDYGANAQLYFDGRLYKDGEYSTDVSDLANADSNPTNDLSAAVKPTEAASVSGDDIGLSKLSATLVLASETKIKIYFTTETIDGLSAAYACEDEVQPHELSLPTKVKDDTYCVILSGIRAYELGKDFTFTLTRGDKAITIHYSPFVFAKNKWDSGDAALRNICKALVSYGRAAADYFD